MKNYQLNITAKQQNKLKLIAHSSQVLAILSLLFLATSLKAQQLQSYDDKNYNDIVHTVLLHPADDSLAKPIINLNNSTCFPMMLLICIIPLSIVITIGLNSRISNR